MPCVAIDTQTKGRYKSRDVCDVSDFGLGVFGKCWMVGEVFGDGVFGNCGCECWKRVSVLWVVSSICVSFRIVMNV